MTEQPDIDAAAERYDYEKGSPFSGWNDLADHIWPKPVDSREELRKQIVRTDHGDNLVVLELSGYTVVVTGAAMWNWWCVETTAGSGLTTSQDMAISKAEGWLIEWAMRGGNLSD